MSMYDVQGGDCMFQVKIGDEYFNFICAKSFSLSTVTDTKETTTPGSGFWKEFRPRKLSYTISLSGMVQVVEENDLPIFKSLLQYQIGFLTFEYRILYIDQSSNPMVITGTAIVQNSLITTDPVNLVDGSVQLLGTGAFEISDTIPVFIDMTVEVSGATDAKCKFILINAQGEQAYTTELLPETEDNAGWLLPGQIVTFKVLSGSYYVALQATEVNSDDNDFDLDTPAPIHLDFDHNPFFSTTYPSVLHDFTADRNATFTIGEELPPPVCVDVTIVGAPELPDGEVGIPYFYSFDLDGDEPFELTINDRPSWMNIAINGSTVEFSGTPDVDGTGIDVDITIANCSTGSENFTDTIDVTEASEEQSVINWTFAEDNANGSLVIRLNGSIVVFAFDNDSGSFNALPDDEIIATVGSGADNTRALTVNATVGGEIYNNTDIENQTFTFTVTNGVNYTVAGFVQIIE